MQVKTVLATIAALAMGSAIANPLPVDNVEDNELFARSKQTPQDSDLSIWRQQALTYAQSHVNQYPTADQIQQAQSWFPWYPQHYTYDTYWPVDLWAYYYYYLNYPQYTWYWESYYPYCTPGLLC